ncbi:MAG TPA: amidase [Candidatus Cybelea sp.]|nr:amidase [Candidatus Cybelea sp.]
MNIAEYARYDATGLAELVARREVSAKELAETAAAAIAAANPKVNAVVELYRDRIEALDERSLADGPFRGVPFLIKDIGAHLKGRKFECGSRLLRDEVADGDSHVGKLFQEAGLNIIGRSNAPEFSIAGTTENALYGNTSTPWRQGYSAGGSTGGGAAAVASGMVPMAHGSDIGGSIRIPASLCGGIGIKPSRGRVSAGPKFDEGGWGLAMNFAQTRTVRDTAALLDCMAKPQVGDPFVIPKPEESYLSLIARPARKLRIAWSTKPLMDAPVDPEVAAAVEATAKVLAAHGHAVEEAHMDFDAIDAARRMVDLWFFGFAERCDELGAKHGRKPGPDTLEPVTLKIYEYARSITRPQFLASHSAMNTIRRRAAVVLAQSDVWMSPTTAAVSEPHGLYNQGRSDLSAEEFLVVAERPLQYTFPHNVMGTPAISLPLAMHSNGLPIGVQLGARPAQEHLLLQLAALLEQEMPWKDRTPPLHVTKA